MMKMKNAQRLGTALFEVGLTPWLAESGDGYVIRILIQGEIINVFWTDCESAGDNLKNHKKNHIDFKGILRRFKRLLPLSSMLPSKCEYLK